MSYMNYQETLQQKKYQKMKLEAKIKEEELLKAKKKASSAQLYDEFENDATTVEDHTNG